MELLVGHVFTDGPGHSHLGENFVIAQLGGKHPSKEIFGRNDALTGAALDDNFCVQGEHAGRIVRCGMGLGYRAANGAAIAHLGIADLSGS